MGGRSAAVAATLDIELSFLLSCSPNLNLIERLWKFVKRDVLYDRYHETFSEFCGVIGGCLGNISIRHSAEPAALMAHNFQRFAPASSLTT